MKVFNNYKSSKDNLIKEEKLNNKSSNKLKKNKKVLILSCGTGGRT